jgi:uncharacterized membrane protein
MRKYREDNTVSVLQKAISYYNIPVTKSAVRETLKSHSHYPTFKSICDSLREWRVDHYPLKYMPEELKEIPAPYIVHFNKSSERIALVTEISNGRVTYYDYFNSKIVSSYDEYIENCSGALILLNPDDSSGDKGYKDKRKEEILNIAVLPAIGVSLFFFILGVAKFSTFITDLGFLLPLSLSLTKSAGILLAVLLVMQEFDIRFTLTEKLCHINKSTNCNTVLNDKSSKIFGWFGWADFGIIYFTGGLVALLSGIDLKTLQLLALLSVLSLPYPIFSVYYQGFVLKKWCPLCLGVQVILITEFVLLAPYISLSGISYLNLAQLILIFLITGIIYVLYILYIREKASKEKYYHKYLSFRKNPAVLKALILSQQHYVINHENGMYFGDRSSSLIITAFLSLHCSHCVRAFKTIKEIIKKDCKAGVNIFLVASEYKLIYAMNHLLLNGKGAEALDMLEYWYNADSDTREELYENICVPDFESDSKEISEATLKIYKECNVKGTPTFLINGYMLPVQYDIEDVNYLKEVFR